MPGEQTGYPHIFVGEDYSDRMDYTRPRGGGGENVIPSRNIGDHAARLRTRLDTAWEASRSEINERRAAALPARTGTYLEFVSDPGAVLVTKSLEDRRRGIRLLSIREQKAGDKEETTTFATVFVPDRARGHFLKRVNQYESERRKSGEPKHRRLIDSIADVRRAVLDSFWTDSAPTPADQESWCEAWIRTTPANEQNDVQRFRDLLDELNIEATEGCLFFPERAVIQIRAKVEHLAELIQASDEIAEFRLAKQTATFWLDLPNADQAEAVEELLGRVDVQDTGVSVCVLDTGVNNGHPLLTAVLSTSDCHAVRDEWGINDSHGHGSRMAGVAAFGDLQEALATGARIRVTHFLESAKLLPNPGDTNPHDLYGFLTSQAVSRAEIQSPDRNRIVCMAVSSVDYRDRGKPSSWSGQIDAMCSGADDGQPRLFVVAAGNTREPQEWKDFPNGTLTNEIHDPGQAWNPLTVGAWTQKTNIQDPAYAGYEAIAPSGSISPFTSTSLTWEKNKWPTKPDILMEGGNAAGDEFGNCADIDDLALLSTHREPLVRHFAPHSMTSAATALAARMAARIQAAYPDAWPETIRALIVHSADWTPAMRAEFLQNESKTSYARLLRICGYGVPNMGRAMRCASNNLTLIAQREIQPYDKKGGRYINRDMHIHQLPWPRQVLEDLGETQVALRITLSYFVEPGPGEIGWRDRYRYASHSLRFELNTPLESRQDFLVRLNKAAREEGQKPETSADSQRWKIGSTARNRGSVHSDIWVGSAAEIAQTNLIGIYPVIGWWRERYHLGCWNQTTRYSLVVSLSTPQQKMDVYTPVANVVGLPTTIETAITT